MEYILHTGKLVIPVEIWHALELKCFVVTVLFSHRFVLHTKNETGLGYLDHVLPRSSGSVLLYYTTGFNPDSALDHMC